MAGEASTARRPSVAVVGAGWLPQGDPRLDLAEALGRALVDARFRVICGGTGGVMGAACRGGRASPHHVDGDLVGLLPGLDAGAGNPWLDLALPTGLGHARNALVARSQAVVAIGGGAGTLSELALAWIHDRVVIAFRVEGWSGKLADTRIDERRRPFAPEDDRVLGVSDVPAALDHLHRLLCWPGGGPAHPVAGTL